MVEGGVDIPEAINYNSEFIGVCVIGDYENKDKLTDTEYNDLISAICHIMKKYDCYSFLGHREVKATACPGKNIDLNKIKKEIKDGANVNAISPDGRTPVQIVTDPGYFVDLDKK